jgi:hypothetical protein
MGVIHCVAVDVIVMLLMSCCGAAAALLRLKDPLFSLI